jgi:ribosomal protein S18 acetylase RimI-like enzyme
MRQRLDSILSDLHCRTFIAEVDNRIRGMVGTVTHFSHEYNDPSGKIITLVVSNERRRCGIGRALLAAAEKDFVSRGVRRVSLTTRFPREQAHQFYAAAGYAKAGFRFAKEL